MNLIATEIPSACAFAAVAVIALCTHSILTAPCVPFGLIAKLRYLYPSPPRFLLRVRFRCRGGDRALHAFDTDRAVRSLRVDRQIAAIHPRYRNVSPRYHQW